jgi:hypothetical protein
LGLERAEAPPGGEKNTRTRRHGFSRDAAGTLESDRIVG